MDARIRSFVHPDFSSLVGSLISPAPATIPNVNETIYHNIDELPEYARPAIAKLMERGLLLGVAADDLGLTNDLIRMLIINDRAGLYDYASSKKNKDASFLSSRYVSAGFGLRSFCI